MNKQITEDYVSYEIAKLLKEKGFNEEVRTFYTSNGKLEYCAFPLNHNLDIGSGFLSAPTYQMALKWLRENYKLLISIGIEDDGYYNIIQNIENKIFYDSLDGYGFCSYEQAVEAALKYTLENLI